MANSLLRTRKVGSLQASTSWASGRPRQSRRSRVNTGRVGTFAYSITTAVPLALTMSMPPPEPIVMVS